jgi:hypothetical protein
MEHNEMWFVEIQPLFRRILFPAYSGLKVRASLSAFFMFFSVFAYSSVLKIKAACSSETTVEFQGATRRHVLENKTLDTTTALRISQIVYFSSFIISAFA